MIKNGTQLHNLSLIEYAFKMINETRMHVL